MALDADVAFLDTRAYYGDEEWKNGEGTRRLVLGYYPMILEGNVNALADERFALLFVGDRLKARWESDEVRNDRDMVETPRGFLVFARSGSYRLA